MKEEKRPHTWKLNLTCLRCHQPGTVTEDFPCCDCAKALRAELKQTRAALRQSKAALTTYLQAGHKEARRLASIEAKRAVSAAELALSRKP